MTQQVGSWNGPPTRWDPSAADDADPTGGRHVLDQDAALTPIFTALRRGEWRRPRPARPARPPRPPAARPLRSVPDPDRSRDRSWDGPPTGPIPVVPPLHVVDPWSPGSFAAPVSPSAPLPTEVTTWWSPADGRDPGRGADAALGRVSGHRPDPYAPPSHDRADHGTYDPGPGSGSSDRGFHDPQFHDPGSSDSRSYDSGFHDAVPYDSGSHDSRFHDSGFHDSRSGDPRFNDWRSRDPRFHEAGFHGRGFHDSRIHDSGSYDAPSGDPRFHARAFSGGRYRDPVSDTGRHHRRLAPAGW